MDREILKLRFTSAVIFIILFLGSFLSHWLSFLFLFLFIAFAGGREYARMQKRFERKIFKPYKGIAAGLVATIPIFFYVYLAVSGISSDLLKWLLIMAVALTIIILVDMFRKKEPFLFNLPFLLSAFIYPGIFLATPVIVVLDIEIGSYQKYYLLVMVFCIWAADAGAYLIGSTLGRTKLFPRLSPSKTIEGALGGLTLSILVGYLSAILFSISSITGFIIGLICGVLGVAGDLYESKIKRTALLKDSSRIIPGHGGILDRFDGFILVLPTISLLLWWILDLG